MPPRILVLSASVDAGHLRAAEAVELALKQTLPDATLRKKNEIDLPQVTLGVPGAGMFVTGIPIHRAAGRRRRQRHRRRRRVEH
jgi:hypothetical protein